MDNALLLQIAFLVWRLTADNELFYHYIIEWDIDDTIEWYEEFYKYIYNHFDKFDDSVSMLEVVNDELDKNKLNSLLYWYMTS